jgi:hypothetical protein
MTKLTREQLYNWVWTCSVRKIASQLGLSDAGLANKCKVNNIPTPGRGYWRKLETGSPVQRTPLPFPEHSIATVSVEVSEEMAMSLNQYHSPVVEQPGAPNASMSTPSRGLHNDELTTGTTVDRSPEVAQTAAPEPTEWEFDRFNPRDVIAISSCRLQADGAAKFLEYVRSLARGCDLPTKAVIALWIERAEKQLSRPDPMAAELVECCRRIARGLDKPAWWDL